MSPTSLASNKTIQILTDAENGGYGVLAPVIYNLEHIVAFVRAAEKKRSPMILQMFPWAITFSNGLLVHACAQAAKDATVPISVHLDHAQDEALIKHAADKLPFDSIMVDMSHHERDENLAKTKELVAYCHARGIATEAEPGRIEGGEDGIASTADLEAVMTTVEDVEDFYNTGVDFLAPAFGNIHGEYGPAGPQFDFERLEGVRKAINGRLRIAMHGTNGLSEEIMKKCIEHGVSKVNVNRLVLQDSLAYLKENAGTATLTQLIWMFVDRLDKLFDLPMSIVLLSETKSVSETLKRRQQRSLLRP